MKWISLLSLAQMISAQTNFVVYLCDDLGYGEINNPLIDTPNINLLASQGMTLARTYTVPVCGPSRWSALTGSTEVQGNGVDGMVATPKVTLPKALQQQGYITGIVGKYGHGDASSLSSASSMGFNYSFVYPTHVQAHVTFAPWLEENGRRINTRNAYAPDLFLTRAKQFIENNQRSKFFLWWSPNIPHVGKYKTSDKAFHSPVVKYGQYKKKPWTRDQKGHAAMITYYIDRDIGQLLAQLQHLNIDHKTMVLFTSDNGAEDYFNVVNFFKANGALRGSKRDVYEGGVRVPTIVRWAGTIPENTKSYYPWKLQDLLPTITTIAGKTVSKPSVVSVEQIWLHGDRAATDIKRDYLSIDYCPKNIKPCTWAFYDLRKWQSGLFKMLQNGLNIEVYDLNTDPGENANLAGNKSYAAIIAHLTAMRTKSLLPN